MARRKHDENSPPAGSGTPNSHPAPLHHGRRGKISKLSERVKKTRDAKAAQDKASKEKKLRQARRKALKQRQHENSLTVERPDDTDEIRALRAALVRVRRERNAAEAAVPRVSRRQGPADRPILQPRNLSKITIADVRNDFGKPCSVKAWEARMTRLERLQATIIDSDNSNVFPSWYKGTGPRAPSHLPDSSPSPPASPNRNDAANNSYGFQAFINNIHQSPSLPMLSENDK
ncbi:hypothetical protein GGX14DRAFT_399526 [Mycena pura]|uniref:Uncharacterized protein n=1 Tax=Mycena pura TaxID=153505 RepID=A0AAD6Y8L6_9AGAR|nr:hypothetical protein GGX14DRAFT_399526 [Mycena pura]